MTTKSAEIVALHSANRNSVSVAYGRLGNVQVLGDRFALYEEARESFERVLSFEPTSTFLLLDCGDFWEYVRCGPGSLVPRTEPTPQGNQYVMPGCEKDKTRGPAQLALW